jgi:hypothetical protein
VYIDPVTEAPTIDDSDVLAAVPPQALIGQTPATDVPSTPSVVPTPAPVATALPEPKLAVVPPAPGPAPESEPTPPIAAPTLAAVPTETVEEGLEGVRTPRQILEQMARGSAAAEAVAAELAARERAFQQAG